MSEWLGPKELETLACCARYQVAKALLKNVRIRFAVNQAIAN